LERVYQQGIAQLQREDRETRRAKIWQERFPWFLGAALFLLLLEALVRPNSIGQKRAQRTQNKKTLRSFVAILFLLVPFIAKAEETPRSAMRKGLKSFEAGDYTNAVQYLEKTALEFPDIGNYNLGNAHYRNGDFEAAEKNYTEALRSTDLQLQANAYFNRGNALLARTTVMTEPEQIQLAAELAFQAEDMFEKSILLAPDDLAAKRNFERARNLRIKLEFNRGKWLYDQAEGLLKEFKAKDAKKNYLQAKTQFEHILNNIDPNQNKSKQYLANVDERLEMLKKAVEESEQNLATAIQQIKDYQYLLAGQRLVEESDARKYAFDLKPELKKKYEETVKKDQEVLKIIKELSTLNQI
jgi:tetratricopeptide (TPR) repeat protein